MISVVIRCKDEAASIGRVLELLATQTITPQIVVVDSGSTDGTVDIVRRHGVDELIEIPPESFTFGGSLNTGAEACSGEVIVALSAHSFPLDDGWLERVAEAMADPRVACASGQRTGPDGAPIEGLVLQDAALAEQYPRWGYSSHAGAFRADLWRRRGFRTDMPGSEDKEWAWYWLHQGHLAAFGLELVVEHGHGSDPARDQYRRARIEWTGLGMFLDVSPQSRREALREWWSEREAYDSAWRARLSHKRMARLLGAYAGRRAATTRS